MKALGADTQDILFMTMGEAALMGVLGGIIGIIGGEPLYISSTNISQPAAPYSSR